MNKFLTACLLCLLMPLAGWAIDDGTYYLYNVGAGMFFDHGGSDNYTACFKPHGAPVILKNAGTDTYTIQTCVDKTAYLDENGKVRTATAGVNFSITAVDESTYMIAVNGKYLGYGGTISSVLSGTLVSFDLSLGGGDNVLWKILSKEDLEAEFDKASPTNPVDATFYIRCANWNRHDMYLEAWSNFVKDKTSGNCGSYLNNNCGYFYGTSTDANQVLTGLRPGMYKLKAQAFYCHGPVANVGTTYTAATMPKKALLYAGSAETEVEGVMDEISATNIFTNGQAVDGGYIPVIKSADSNDAAKAFDTGMYSQNEVTGIVGSDGTLSIGIKMEDGITGSYIAHDNFELYYLGPVTSISEEEVNALLATVPEGTMATTVKEAMDAAVAALKANATVENYNAADSAITAAKANVQAYIDIKAALDEADATTLSDEAKAQYTAAVADIVAAYNATTLEGDGAAEVEAINEALANAKAFDISQSNDKTALIANPQFDEGTSGWSGDFGNGAKKGLASNYVITSFGGGFDIYQEISGLTPGIYKLQMQAFSRPTGNDDTWTAYQAGEDVTNETYIYANDAKKKVKLIVEDYMTTAQSSGTWSTYTLDDKSIYVPNNSTAFSVAFSAGLYDNELICVVGEDGKLKLGIRNEDTENSNSYAGYDNVRLTYIGSADMTDKIVNPQFDEGTSGWDGDFGAGAKKGLADNYVITCYGTVFDIHQTITGLLPGTYKLQAQAFSRPAVNDDTWTAYQAGNTLANETYLYANGAQQKVKLIVEDYLTTAQTSGTWSTYTLDGKSIYVPNNSTAFSVAFSAGLFETELLCTVGEDGKLTIGIKNEDSSNSITYAGYDNFRLTYISSEVVEEQENVIETANAALAAYKSVAEQATDHSAFDAAYNEAAEILAASPSNSEITAAQASVLEALKNLMKTGTTATGQFNITALIQNPDFASDDKGWTSENGTYSRNSIGVLESTSSSADRLTQTLAGMPAGKYTLKVQGFYRSKEWKQAQYDYEHGNETMNLSLVFNDQTVPMKSIFADGQYTLASACISRTEDVGATIEGRGFPLLNSKVSETLTPGVFWNYIEVEVGEDGDITFGVDRKASTYTSTWTILDNFRLYYGERNAVTLTSPAAYSMADDTPAEVIIKKKMTAGVLTPLAVPCDIPGSKFKAVYEIGSLNASTKTAVVYPVENVRAGVPCFVEMEEDADSIIVGKTVLTAAEADTQPVLWDGGIISPNYKTLNWRAAGFTGKYYGGAYFTNIEKLDLNDMSFVANIENYQVRMFLAQTYTTSSSSVVSDYNKPIPARRDLPHAIGIPVPASKANGAVVNYSLNSDMTDAKSLDVENNSTVCYIQNLVPGNRYYYSVESAGEVVSKGNFKVEGPFRSIYAPSVYNIRDFGGRTMQDGRITNYGLIYRGGEVNGYHPSIAGDVERLKELGIGAEIDLRWKDTYDQDRETGKSAFGFVKGEDYYFAAANDYLASDLSSTDTQGRLKEEFQFLLKHIRDGKGVYFHCVFGADRTGFFAFLLQGLLGFTLDDMLHDYEMTSFAAPAGNRNKSAIQERIAVIQDLTGSTLRDKFENYWTNSVGITADEVKEFRSIMLHEPISKKDVNADGKVDTQDVLNIYDFMRYNASKVTEAEQDVNADGLVDTQDALDVYESIEGE